jgi:hypothetical protein
LAVKWFVRAMVVCPQDGVEDGEKFAGCGDGGHHLGRSGVHETGGRP